MSDHIHRTSEQIREQSLIKLLATNITLQNRLSALYTALGLDPEETTQDDAVAVCVALRQFWEANG